MTVQNNGGPAFPQTDLSAYNMGPAETGNGGMTLRDWFAGQALAGHIAHEGGGATFDLDATAAYKWADAMIAARGQP